MALPNVLKHFNVFEQGQSFLGLVETIKLPKLSKKMEAYRGGGMLAEVEMDLGLEKLELEQELGGFCLDAYKQFGVTTIDGVMLRFAGSYQRDDTGQVQAVEVVVRGRHKEIDPGDSKSGDKGKTVVKSVLTYYKLTVDGKVVIEIDVLSNIYTVDGVDILAEHRKAIGLA